LWGDPLSSIWGATAATAAAAVCGEAKTKARPPAVIMTIWLTAVCFFEKVMAMLLEEKMPSTRETAMTDEVREVII
jgi:hypothetical protein